MDATEALKKIEEINSVIQSSNKALFSGRHMMLYGIIVLLVPIIGWSTQWLTFGHDFGSYMQVYTSVANTAFFWALSWLINKVIPRSKAYHDAQEVTHPLIRKAFSLTRPIVVAIFGVVIVFALIGQSQLSYPMVLILIGLMFSVFGKFTIPQVTYIAWTYIACGLLLPYLNQFQIPYLTLYFLVYNGLSDILMGYFLTKAETNYAH